MLQAAHSRAEGLQRDNLSLKSQLSMLTEQTQAAAGDAESAGRTPEAASGGSLASSRWCVSGSSGPSAGASGAAYSAGGELPYTDALGGDGDPVFNIDAARARALRSGGSVDGRSQKSDHLTAVSYTHLTLPTTPYV